MQLLPHAPCIAGAQKRFLYLPTGRFAPVRKLRGGSWAPPRHWCRILFCVAVTQSPIPSHYKGGVLRGRAWWSHLPGQRKICGTVAWILHRPDVNQDSLGICRATFFFSVCCILYLGYGYFSNTESKFLFLIHSNLYFRFYLFVFPLFVILCWFSVMGMCKIFTATFNWLYRWQMYIKVLK